MHEALDNVPVPVLAGDDSGTIVLANRAAHGLFAAQGPVLGCALRQLFPGLPEPLPDGASFAFEHKLGEQRLHARMQPMGNGSQSRGWLIVIEAA